MRFVVNGAGGDTCHELKGDAPGMMVHHDEDIADGHRNNIESRSLALAANGIPVREAKNTPRVHAAIGSEGKELWDMRCWATGR